MCWHIIYVSNLCISLQTQHTLRFSGAQNHRYLVNFLKSVAQRYDKDGRAGDLVVDLLKLKVPKLFAVEGGGEKDENVRHKFSGFLKNYIFRCKLKRTIIEEMKKILVREPNSCSYLASYCVAKVLYNKCTFPSTRMQFQTSEMSSSSWFWW